MPDQKKNRNNERRPRETVIADNLGARFPELELFRVEKEGLEDVQGNVRIIALDETGRYENLPEPGEEFRCIGGLIADFPKEEGRGADRVVHEEGEKILDLLKNMITEYNRNAPQSIQNRNWEMRFPFSLHMGNIAVFQKDRERPLNKEEYSEDEEYKNFTDGFRTKVKDTVKQFMKVNEKHYRYYAYLLCENQISFGGRQRSNLVDFSIGSNLYEEMFICAVENAFFYDPACHADQVYLRLASRGMPEGGLPQADAARDFERAYDFEKQAAGGDRYFYLTRTDFVKSSLMHRCTTEYGAARQWRVDIDVRSIPYAKRNDEDDQHFQDAVEKSPFQFLADIICDILKERLSSGGTDPVIYESGLVKKAEKQHDLGMLLGFFSNADRRYRNLMEAMELGNLVSFYGGIYELEKRREKKRSPEISTVEDFYCEDKLPELMKAQKEKLREDSLYREQIISRLQEYWAYTDGFMGTRENAYEKGMYVASCLRDLLESEEISGAIMNPMYKGRYLFRFSSIILRGMNHRGMIRESEELIRKYCEPYKDCVGLEEYLDYTLNAVQVPFNSMDYDAITRKYMKKVIGSYSGGQWDFSEVEKLKEAMQSISGTAVRGYLPAAKLYGTFAQARSFQQQRNAEYYFRKAMEEIPGDRGNIDITRSYLMHYYIDQAEKAAEAAGSAPAGRKNARKTMERFFRKYEEEAVSYFGVKKSEGKDEFTVAQLGKQFTKVISGLEKSSELRFALYLYVKALRVFYQELCKNEEGIRRMILTVANEIKLTESKTDDGIHPWQLIGINLYPMLKDTEQFFAEKGRENEAAMARELAEHFAGRVLEAGWRTNSGPTILAMVVAFAWDKEEREGKKLTPLTDKEQEGLSQIFGLEKIGEMDKESIRRVLKKNLVYMYR